MAIEYTSIGLVKAKGPCQGYSSDLTPETLPPSTFDNSFIHDIGFQQSLEWIRMIIVYVTSMILNDKKGRCMNIRIHDL